MAKPIPLSPAALLACAALSCGPKSAETDTNASDTSTTGASTTSTGTTTGLTTTDPSSTSPTGTGPGTGSTTGATTSTSTGTGTTTGAEPHPAEACSLVPDPGDCDAAFQRYFFNPQTQQCEVFTWGGCNGVVPFEDFTDCQNACEPCDAFFAVDQLPSVFPPVEVQIRNDTAAPIFLRSYSPEDSVYRDELFSVWPDGATQPLFIAPSGCVPLCGLGPQIDCDFGCLLGRQVPTPPPIMMQPGAVLTAQWSGQFIDWAHVPTQCVPAPCAEYTCGRWLDAAPGAYEIRVAARSTWECEIPGCCAPNGDGWCEIPDPFKVDEEPYPLELAVPFAFPGGPVELVFQ